MLDCCSYKIQSIQQFIKGGLTVDSGPILWKPSNHIPRFKQTCYITGPLSRQRGFLSKGTIFTIRKGATSSYWMLLYAGVWSRAVWPTALLRIINFPLLWRQLHTYAKLQGVISTRYMYMPSNTGVFFYCFRLFHLELQSCGKINCKIT
jgi:hypothetical protein